MVYKIIDGPPVLSSLPVSEKKIFRWDCKNCIQANDTRFLKWFTPRGYHCTSEKFPCKDFLDGSKIKTSVINSTPICIVSWIGGFTHRHTTSGRKIMVV